MIVHDFRTAHYRFDIEAFEPLNLPAYKGSTLRGGFGYAFKKMVCIQKDWRKCTPCQLGNTCPYGYIFETSVPEDSEVLRSLREVPIPFVIEPPLDDKTAYRPGDRLSFDVVLVGRAINYLPYFILAFQELGRAGIGKPRGKYILQRITSVHPWQSTRELVYDGVDVRVGGRDLSVSAADVVQRVEALPADRLTMQFITPARLKYRGKYVREPEFHVIVRNLLRRISSLSYFHCGQLWETDFRGIIGAAEEVKVARMDVEWVDWERYSGRQQRRINLGGFVGQVTYRGALAKFHALLAWGELVHIGKATVFGHGQYQVNRTTNA
ncbi:MAG: CRISPR system precrRNA processing endoribonuclease RAMP protein Cas6 [Anaerolineae bacterium]